MEDQKEYYAFISYKREDEKWAKWLQGKLEHYKFPTNLNGRTDLPKHIRPTFRDVTDLKPGLLAEEINNALLKSDAMEANNSWEIIDFNNATSIKKFATDTLTCTSTLMLSANRKYLIGSFTGFSNFMHNDSRCVWSSSTYDCLDSVYFLSGPLQDGEHLYYDCGVYSYPIGKKIFQTADLSFAEEELFDNDEMAYIEMSSLSLYDFKKRQKRSIGLRDYGQGEANNYRLLGFRNNFAILFNRAHLMIIDTKTGDLVLQKAPTPYECITSATFFNNQSRVLVTTNAALYVFDLLDYKQLIDTWKGRLRHTCNIYVNSTNIDAPMQELTKLKDENHRTA